MTVSKRSWCVAPIAASIGVLFAALTLSGSLLAQDGTDETEASAEFSSEAEASEENSSSTEASVPDAPSGPAEETEKKAEAGSDLLLTWSGSLEVDVGYAQYEAEAEAVTDDRLNDFRGRFVLGPLLEVPLGNDLFFAATGQIVTWVKNNEANPLLNADDVWGMFGASKPDGSRLWDIQFGRFEATPVYQKFGVIDHDPRPGWGQGESISAFDLFTLEDTGALCAAPLSSGRYCVDIYEVNYILLRDEVGSLAAHWFPIEGLGVELHGKYGQEVSNNHLGGRLAVTYSPVPWLQISGGGEWRQRKSGSPQKKTESVADPASEGGFRSVTTECTDCGRLDRLGGGGGLVLRIPGLGDLRPELAFSGAYGRTDSWDLNAVPKENDSPEVISMGGYAQLSYGDFSIGGAAHTTEKKTPDGSSETHLQLAAYARYALQKHLSLKLVGTYAEGNTMSSADVAREDIVNTFTAVRLRLKYLFNGL